MDEKIKNTGSPILAEQPSQPTLTRSTIRVTRAKAAEAAAKATAVKDDADEDAALIREEDRILEDEEITSDEESEVAAKMERKLMTVALVKSVVDTGGSSNSSSVGALRGLNSSKVKESGPASPRYGLRKRRRPTGNEIKGSDSSQVSSVTGLARLVNDVSGKAGDGSSRVSAAILPPIVKSSSMVPNPLASAPIQPPPILPTTTITSSSAGHGIKAIPPVVPCPLPASLSPEPNPPPPTTSTEMQPPKTSEPDQSSCEKRKVKISEDPVRMRGLSIDLESVELGFPEEEPGSNVGELALPTSGGGRGRAFSFECFAFGISADEPLPPLEDTPTPEPASSGKPPKEEAAVITSTHESLEQPDHPGRPRGESIIFDPSSFQEGGIHEQSALETARAPSSDIPGLGPRSSATTTKPNETTSATPAPFLQQQQQPPVPPPPQPMVSSTVAVQPPPLPMGFPATSTLPAVTSYTATTTTESSTTTTTVTVAASAASAAAASMAMELLNKDGRIGIYLPEARKARIARFHAKRARRIWRKRIKYDCRKKLADSRPRIKGRFVKRSDMEDE